MTKADHEMSNFTLDVYWASGRAADPAVEDHLRRCGRCRAYLEALDTGRAAATAPSLRSGLQNGRIPSAPSLRLGLRAGRTLYAAAAFAAAAGVLLLVRARLSPSGPYVGVKGTPAVELLVRSGRKSRTWDGVSPVHPGDSLALRVACEGMKRIVVCTLDRGRWSRLSETACRESAEVLPFTLVVDSEPGTERFAVVMTTASPGDEDLDRAVSERRRDAHTWVTPFALPKETDAGR